MRRSGFVATEEHPLPDLGGRDQAGALQHGQMRGHRRLGQSAAAVDVAGADAMLERYGGRSSKYALGSFSHARISRRTGLASALRMASALTVGSSPAEAEFEGSGFIFKYRNLSNHISLKIDICSYPRDEWDTRRIRAPAPPRRRDAARKPRARAPHSSPTLPRSRLTSPCSTLRCTRRRCEARVGRVGRRGFSVPRAAPWRSGARSPRRGSFPGCERL